MTLQDGAWRQGAEELLKAPLPQGQQIRLHFSLGKYFDDLKDPEQAFNHYRQANELMRSRRRAYDAAGLEALVGRIERLSANELLGQRPAPDCAGELPVFILGMPRSGTTLTEQILASHPEVFGAGEIGTWDKSFARLESAQASAALPATAAQLAAEYLTRLRGGAGAARRITDKTPGNFLYIGLIHALLPRARFVHVSRDPLDTCLSIYFQGLSAAGSYANDLGHLAHYYGQYRRIMGHWRARLPQESLLEVSYEGLLEDQEGWTRRILEFVGLTWDPACLAFHHTPRAVVTASRWQIRQALNLASVGRWRAYEKHLGPLLALRQ
jgi:hypothetical protein